MNKILLPGKDGSLSEFELSAIQPFQPHTGPLNRIVYAAAHIVANPANNSTIDWDATINYRKHLWSLNIGVAEAMDTAQRGMGLAWNSAKELIRLTLEASKDQKDAKVVCGCGTDHLSLEPGLAIDDVIGAYEEQVEYVESLSGNVVMMASRALAGIATSADDYINVYNRIISQMRQPVLIHWLGEMFDPALEGYWGYKDHRSAMDVVLDIINSNAEKIEGIKISLLDKDMEIKMRRLLPPGVSMYTGDDFNFPELIAGDDECHSEALLGIFDAIAPAASEALGELANGNKERYYEILEPAVALSRHIFSDPTRYYKTGIVFMAYLNGHQDHFTMVGGQETKRSIVHLADIFKLAAKAGLLRDVDMATQRMRSICKLNSIES